MPISAPEYVLALLMLNWEQDKANLVMDQTIGGVPSGIWGCRVLAKVKFVQTLGVQGLCDWFFQGQIYPSFLGEWVGETEKKPLKAVRINRSTIQTTLKN